MLSWDLFQHKSTRKCLAKKELVSVTCHIFWHLPREIKRSLAQYSHSTTYVVKCELVQHECMNVKCAALLGNLHNKNDIFILHGSSLPTMRLLGTQGWGVGSVSSSPSCHISWALYFYLHPLIFIWFHWIISWSVRGHYLSLFSMAATGFPFTCGRTNAPLTTQRLLSSGKQSWWIVGKHHSLI